MSPARRLSYVEGVRRDFVDALFAAGYNDNEVAGQLQTVAFGGIDSTVASLEWALMYLTTHPATLARVQAEIDDAFREEYGLQQTISSDDVERRLPLLRAVLKETMRLKAPLPRAVPHCSAADTTLGKFSIPKDTQITVDLTVLARDCEDPEFRPERYLDDCGGGSGVEIGVTGTTGMAPFGASP